MTEKSDRKTKLLAEVFHDDWSEGPAAGFARQAALQARRRRQFRSWLMTAGAATVLTFAMVLSFHSRPAPMASVPFALNSHRAYEIISDDDLLAQLHDRPLLAIQRENGTREFVLLEVDSRAGK